MRRRTFALVVAVAMLVGLIPLSASAAAPAYTVGDEFPVSLAENGQVQPDIDYPWIVWKDNRFCESDEQSDIYAYNFATGEEVQVTDLDGPESNPSISGDWVVYSNYTYNGDQYCSVWATNLVTGEDKLIADGDTDMTYYGNPAIDGDLVVYKTDDDSEEIYLYDLVADTATLLTDDTDGVDSLAPEIGDGWIVWHDNYYDGSYWQYDIVAYEIATGTTTTIIQGHHTSSTDYMQYWDPSVADGHVACVGYGRWTGDADQDCGIFLYDLAEIDTVGYEAVQISGGIGFGRVQKPSITDGLVAWHEDRTNDGYSWYYDIYTYDIATETESLFLQATDLGTSDAAYGGRTALGDGIIAWHDHRDEGVNSDGTSTDDLYAMFLDSVPPVAVADAYGTMLGTPLSKAAPGVLANDTDPDADPLMASLVSGTTNGALTLNANGSFTYTPDAGFVGTDSFTYVAHDGTYESNPVTVTIVVIEGGGAVGSAVYRFYNPVTGAHFFTSSLAERNDVLAKYPNVWFYEGVAFVAAPAAGTVPLHRFYNASAVAHFYTASEAEKAAVLAKWPTLFAYEGTTYSVALSAGAGRIAVYRFYNTLSKSHFYTTSSMERDNIIGRWSGIYHYEGVAYYVVSS